MVATIRFLGQRYRDLISMGVLVFMIWKGWDVLYVYVGFGS